MKDFIGELSENWDFFEEVFNAFSYIVIGLGFLISILLFSINIELLYSDNLLKIINSYGEHIPTLFLSIIILYYLGRIAELTFDLFINILSILVKILNKIKFKNHEPFKKMYDFFLIIYPLHSQSLSLSALYKNSVKKSFAQYFNVSGDISDVDRLCKQLCTQKKLIKLYKTNNLFIFYKGIFITLLLLIINLILKHYDLISLFFLLLLLFILKEIRSLTLKVRIQYIDAAITYLSEQRKK